MAPDPHGTKSQDVCGYELRPFSGPERHNNANILLKSLEDLGLSKISGPAYPSYATYGNRLKTFESWKFSHIQTPEKLAEAGFYHPTLSQDNTLCFHCGGGLKNWEKDDDPWVEHAKWFSRCGFVILQKGKGFIKDVLAKADAWYEKEHEVKETKSKSEIAPKIEVKAEEKTKSKEPNKCPAKVEKPSRSTESPSSDKKEIELCRICYTNEREIVFLPCGHFVSCSQCAPSLSMCAVCRKPFEAVVRAYLS